MDGQDRIKKEYAHIDQLSTEALEALLRADIDAPDNNDDEIIMHILEVIEQREMQNPTGRLSDIDIAWEDFQKYYNTSEGMGLSLFSENEPKEINPKIQRDFKIMKKEIFHIVRRSLTAAVIVACLVVFIMPPALGYQNFVQMIGHWSENSFYFSSTPSIPSSTNDSVADSGEKFDSLESALESYNITEAVVPQWIPDGFNQESVTVTESPEFNTIDFNAFYENNTGKTISVSVTSRNTAETAVYEKDEDGIIRYTVGGITHYIFENYNRTVSTWYVGSLECSIKADISLADMEKMIDSIYER